MKNYNLHTHSVYCGHGEDLPHDYAEKALGAGLGILGFSEHLPFRDHRLSSSRMDISAKPQFLNDVYNAKAEFRDRGLEILLGWECDWFEDMRSYYDELLEETDYLTFGCHWLEKGDGYETVFRPGLGKREIGMYADTLIAGIESGYFDFVAHPDVFFFGYEKWDDESKAVSKAIISACMDKGLPMEINGNGFIRESPYPDRMAYPMKPFWELAVEMGADEFITNTDAHKAELVAYALPLLDEWIKPMGIELLDIESTHPLRFRKAR